MQPQVSIIIPCFNEEAAIEATTHLIISYMRDRFAHYRFELLLVNDGSSDSTPIQLDRLGRFFPDIVKARSLPFHQGRGAAIKDGIASSVGSWVVIMDADLTYDVNHIGDILTEFEGDPRVDTVVVSPYMKGGVVKNVPWSRLFVSRLANWILSGFFEDRLSTVTCVVRGYKGSFLRSLPLFESGKELHLEILRKLSLCGAHIVEIPGRLIWKKQKIEPRRRNNLKVFRSAKDHLLYALLIRPTYFIRYLAFGLVFVGLWEMVMILKTVVGFFPQGTPFWDGLWIALSASFAKSPHSFVIGSLCLLLGFQAVTALALFQILKLQQEETLRHILAGIGKRENPCAEY